jgi:hypothetical protein
MDIMYFSDITMVPDPSQRNMRHPQQLLQEIFSLIIKLPHRIDILTPPPPSHGCGPFYL